MQNKIGGGYENIHPIFCFTTCNVISNIYLRSGKLSNFPNWNIRIRKQLTFSSLITSRLSTRLSLYLEALPQMCSYCLWPQLKQRLLALRVRPAIRLSCCFYSECVIVDSLCCALFADTVKHHTASLLSLQKVLDFLGLRILSQIRDYLIRKHK